MDRRSFLTGVLGLAGTAAVVTAVKPSAALAGMPNRPGILDDLETADAVAGDTPEVELVDHRRHHSRHDRRHHNRHRRRRRRREWRTVCSRYWRHGRWRKRCHRERVWVWFWA
ncbi:twin-arginine translocation signal domain-containing protein [Mesorhizobium sp. CN5-321]|jgi:hypothetical protein|uniref:twin-arginine translocation signal domain-containing protein n=1 Tax=Mesorhizobium hunchu TaxID=3157708 RepID=UPI0032B77E01